jgi:HD-like signal output (HDOD) protein
MFGFLKRRGTDPQAELRKSLGGLELPVFPAIVMQTLKAIRDPEASVASVARVLGSDPGMSVQVLRLVNSASRGGARKIASVDRAVAVVGMSEVESLVLSIGVARSLPKKAVEGFEPTRFWTTAARRASIARSLTQELHPAMGGVSFTAGLLQDMAIPLLASARDDYGPLLTAWHSGEADLAEIERSEFGWDHSEVATWLCASWQLPETLAEAIGAHHGTVDGLSAPAAVTLVATLSEAADSGDIDRLVTLAHERYGMKTDRCVELIEEAELAASELTSLFV